MRALLYLGALLLTVLGAIGLEWATTNYRDRPGPKLVFDDPRLSFRPAEHLARSAVRKFRELPVEEQQALREELSVSTSTLEQWARRHVDQASVVCLGERHEDDIRRFIATRVLPVLKFDVLMLETSRTQLEHLLEQHAQGRPVTLLDADFADIVHSVRARPSPVRLVAIDEYQAGKSGQRAERVSLREREHAVVDRLRSNWSHGNRHTVLFGALHCRAVPGWMVHELEQRAPQIGRQGILGTVILARYREASAQVLMYLLEEIGINADVVVVPRVSRFPKLIQQWLPPSADAMAGYDSAILFDERAQDAVSRTE